MSTINKSLAGFMFNGAALALASASWKGNVNIIYGFNSAGNAYTSFKPSSSFNSLTQLAQDGVYIVDVKTPGFDIPGALLTAGVPTVNPLSLGGFRPSYSNQGSQLSAEIEIDLGSTDARDKSSMLLLAQGDNILSVDGMSDVGGSSAVGVSTLLSYNTTYRAIMVTNLGHALVEEFKTPQAT